SCSTTRSSGSCALSAAFRWKRSRRGPTWRGWGWRAFRRRTSDPASKRRRTRRERAARRRRSSAVIFCCSGFSRRRRDRRGIGRLLCPRATLRRLLEIEELLGRVRREQWGAREIDLDLLLYGDRIVADGALRVPHPRLHERAFVLVPLAELAPDSYHPQMART